MKYRLVVTTVVLLVFAFHGDSRADSAKIDFAHDILPILKARCAECHTNGKYKASFSLDTREEILKARAVVLGKSADSELWKRVNHEDVKKRMPPKGDKLSAKELDLIKAWIEQGLPWQEGFSFRPGTYNAPLKLRKIELPAVQGGREHPIDRLMDAYYARNKIALPPELDDTLFLRRTSLDIIGLLPGVEESEAFRNDKSPDKRNKWVRRLLDDKRAYADHWLTFWNDLLRNDYRGTGYIDGGRKQITGWLYAALLQNKPYDQFVRELIHPNTESEGFINGIKWRGNVNASQVREVQFSQNVSQVFLGINMKCASCHDSFIDSWKLDDAYGLAAVIADQPLEIHRCDKAIGKKAVPRFMFAELGEIDATAPKAKRLERLADLVVHRDNGRFSRTIVNRIWHRFMGRGLIHPVDAMAGKPWNEDLLEYLAGYFIEQRYDLKKLMEHIVLSRTYQTQHVSIARELPVDEYVFRGPEVKRMTAEQFLDAVWTIGRSGPGKHEAPITPPAYTGPAEQHLVRASLVNADALMRSLGRPNREQVVTTRPDLLTTLQALDLSNGPIMADHLTRAAAHVLKEKKWTGEPLIESLYLKALGRKPTDKELETALTVAGKQPTNESVADLLWVVFMLPEFQLIR